MNFLVSQSTWEFFQEVVTQFFFSLHFKAEVTMEVQSQEIKSENKEEEQQRQQLTDNAFGPNPQPVLEKVEFKVCSSYYQ